MPRHYAAAFATLTITPFFFGLRHCLFSAAFAADYAIYAISMPLSIAFAAATLMLILLPLTSRRHANT